MHLREISNVNGEECIGTDNRFFEFKKWGVNEFEM